MKRLIPTGAEMAIFAVAAWMGMRRSGQWAAIAQPIEAAKETVDAEEEEPAV